MSQLAVCAFRVITGFCVLRAALAARRLIQIKSTTHISLIY
jgi:hypothetical protein